VLLVDEIAPLADGIAIAKRMKNVAPIDAGQSQSVPSHRWFGIRSTKEAAVSAKNVVQSEPEGLHQQAKEGGYRQQARLPLINHILLELGREPGSHPFGDRSHVYHLYLPLLEDGRIDAEGWRRTRALCRVRRQRPGEPAASGMILHGPGGHWIFDYPGTAADESGFRLEDERFTVGEYISIKEDDDQLHTFQVVSIKPI
jgi:hypothetical protein